MTDGWVQEAWDERKAFRRARREGRRRASPAAALGLVALIIGLEALVVFIWLRTYIAEGAFPLWGLVAIPAAALIVFFWLHSTVRDTPVLIGIRRAWRRAEAGEVTRVVTGVALRQGQLVGNVPVRTVVAHVDGRARFVRLAFARVQDAARLPAGPVQVDLFDGSAVRGPARLRPLHGGVVWAFAVRNGDLAVAEPTPWTFEDGWPEEWTDGWPDSDGASDRAPDWPSDSDGDGDGDGDGGE